MAFKFSVPESFFHKDQQRGGHSQFDILCADLKIETQAAKNFLRIALENARLMDAKQKDYGSKNISTFGLLGVVVRMNDKFERIKTLMRKKRRAAVNESINDTFRDVSNYAIIALLLESGQWPDEE